MGIGRLALITGLLLTVTRVAARPLETGSYCRQCHQPHVFATGSCVACHRGDPDAVRQDLAHHNMLTGAAAAWKMPTSPVLTSAVVLRDSLACRRCHTTGGRGGSLAINLDTVVRKRSQEQLRDALQNPGYAMPRFGLTTDQCDTLIALLLHDGESTPAPEQYLVRFRESSVDTTQAFTRLCGECHRALGRGGVMGSGTDGPNLSGLTGGFYPTAAGQEWHSDRLARWLRNPRSLRVGTTMPPVAVTDAERESLLQELASGQGQ